MRRRACRVVVRQVGGVQPGGVSTYWWRAWWVFSAGELGKSSGKAASVPPVGFREDAWPFVGGNFDMGRGSKRHDQAANGASASVGYKTKSGQSSDSTGSSSNKYLADDYVSPSGNDAAAGPKGEPELRKKQKGKLPLLDNICTQAVCQFASKYLQDQNVGLSRDLAATNPYSESGMLGDQQGDDNARIHGTLLPEYQRISKNLENREEGISLGSAPVSQHGGGKWT